jgi:putative ABC transport system permease protein
VATLFAVTVVIEPDPWYAPRYILPILGMMLGNALSGTSLVLDSMTQGALRERVAIEGRIALGETRFEAMHDVLRRSLVTGLMPILTAMAATGIVSLPGMMTGQILAGIEPIAAAKYQVMIMLLIVGATGLAVFMAGLGAVLLLTDERHRLRLDRISR